jgi:NADPH-dependent ferric siderophore reductase
MGLFDDIVRHFSYKAVIEYKEQLSEVSYRIRIRAECVKNIDFLPGYFLRLGVGIGNKEALFQEKIRSYSIWAIDKNNGTIDLAIATHSNGMGAKWVSNCLVNDTLTFALKKGNFLIDHTADHYLMIGDLSALSHLYVISRSLAANKKVESIIYSQKNTELYADIDGSKPLQFYEMPVNPYNEIVDKLKILLPTMTGKKMVYIAGDSRICISLNQYFRKELQWQTKQIRLKPFWNPEKKGLE